MAKRIVKVTFDNNVEKFRVETNRRYGFIPCKWRTIQYIDFGTGGLCPPEVDAFFDTLAQAKEFCGVPINDIVKEEVVAIYN